MCYRCHEKNRQGSSVEICRTSTNNVLFRQNENITMIMVTIFHGISSHLTLVPLHAPVAAPATEQFRLVSLLHGPSAAPRDVDASTRDITRSVREKKRDHFSHLLRLPHSP